MLIVGNFRYNITVIRKTVTYNDYGSEIITWNPVYTLKCSKKYGKGLKIENNHEVFSKEFIIFSTHYRNIQIDDRIQLDEKNYLINLIEEVGYREGLNLHCDLINE